MKNTLKKPVSELPPELARFHPTNPAIVAYRQALGDPEMAPLEHWIAVAKFYDIPRAETPLREDAKSSSSAPKSGPSLIRRRRASDRS